MAASLIVPRGADGAESKHVVVMKTEAVAKAVASTVARIVSTTDYTYSNLFNGFSASLTKSELKDLLNDPNVDFNEKVSTIYGSSTQKTHPGEFEGRARFVQNFVDNADLDANGHGTHIAGSIGSKTYGVAKKTQLFAVKVLNEYTAGQTSGILAAAGNDATDASHVSPSNESVARTVGATAHNDTRVSFFNYGVSVDVFAPGVYIKSTWIKGGVKLESGTSMATPPIGLAAYPLGIKDIKASELCNLIATMSLKDVIKGIPENTVNLLIQNGEAK
ncbi:hypothetical protein FVER53590_03737 [Fusarium verticillioides]|nr:hypothetical protein FVER53590_03737 [Fusarium verticillioides]